MANNATNTVAAINAAAAAIGSTDPRYTSPEEQGRWKSWWSGLWCFGSQKGGKRIAPTSRTDGTAGSSRVWTTAGPAQAGLAVAPPSSPASFVNSSVQSPASFSLSLSAASANVCSPCPTNTMFTIGPYAHETQLVSPPVFSTFTTEPSTAPFTPPPELAHVTTPSSPDVPFARLVTSSLEAKTSARETVSPFSSSPLASPGEVPAGDLQGAYQLYPGSPVGHLVSPISCISGSGTSSPAVDIEFPARLNASFGTPAPSFPNFKPFTHVSLDQTSSATLFLSHKLEGSKQKLFPEANVSRCRPDLSTGFWKDAAFRGETGMDVPLAESLSCHAVSSGTHQQLTRASIFKHGEVLEESTRDEEKLDGFSSNRPAQNKWNIFHVDAREEDSGRPRTLQDFYTNVLGAALAKRENIGADKWRQHANSIVEEDWGHPVEGLPVLTTVGCPNIETTGYVLEHPVAIRDIQAKDSFNGRKVQEEVNGDSCIDFQESLRAEAAIHVLSLSATSSPPDLRQDNLYMHPGNNSELSVRDVEARGCQSCGELDNKCSKLSAGLEQAKESVEA